MTEPAETNGNLLACHAVYRAEARGYVPLLARVYDPELIGEGDRVPSKGPPVSTD